MSKGPFTNRVTIPNYHRLRHLVEEGVFRSALFPPILGAGLALIHLLLRSFAQGSRLHCVVVDMRTALVTQRSGWVQAAQSLSKVTPQSD